jgi:hypothetical protein
MTAYMYARKVRRPVIVFQEWNVMVLRADGEPVEFRVSCEEGEFGTELAKRGYDLTDPTFDFVREPVK